MGSPWRRQHDPLSMVRRGPSGLCVCRRPRESPQRHDVYLRAATHPAAVFLTSAPWAAGTRRRIWRGTQPPHTRGQRLQPGAESPGAAFLRARSRAAGFPENPSTSPRQAWQCGRSWDSARRCSAVHAGEASWGPAPEGFLLPAALFLRRLCAESQAAQKARKELVCPPSLPEEKYKHFPGGERPGLCFAFLPNLCLTARSSPSSHGALPGAARGQRGSGPFPVPTPRGTALAHQRGRRGKWFSKPHLLGVKKNPRTCVGLSFPPFTTSYPLPPSLNPSDELCNQQDHDMDLKPLLIGPSP